MRVAPIGAYFADDYTTVVRQARVSAATTHAHPEGQAGAIAVAIAAAWAAQSGSRPKSGSGLLDATFEWTPDGETRFGIERARSLDRTVSIKSAVAALGNGSRITAPDTVPFALWCAARHIDDYVEALWAAVSAGGDNDSNAAIVGGVVALAGGPGSIPVDWLKAREAFEPSL